MHDGGGGGGGLRVSSIFLEFQSRVLQVMVLLQYQIYTCKKTIEVDGI